MSPDRVKYRGQPVRIPRTALAIPGGMQPDRLRGALAGADDGLAARLAYVWPDPAPILSLANEAQAEAHARCDQLTAGARRLYGLAMDRGANAGRAASFGFAKPSASPFWLSTGRLRSNFVAAEPSS